MIFAPPPVYQPLYASSCGTWVDVPVVSNVVNNVGIGVNTAPSLDLQLLAVRFVDPGHPDQEIGPRYRLWARNNSNGSIEQPFSVSLVAGVGGDVDPNYPQSGVRVPRMDAGEVAILDIRLPYEANQIGLDEQGRAVPFTTLTAIIDSGNEIGEPDKSNNGAMLARDEILPIDPALFAAEDSTLSAGQTVALAGEGLGPEAGQIILVVNNQSLQGEIEGWFDLGLRVKLPPAAVNGPTAAQLIVVRGDGAMSNPVDVTINRAGIGSLSLLER